MQIPSPVGVLPEHQRRGVGTALIGRGSGVTMRSGSASRMDDLFPLWEQIDDPSGRDAVVTIQGMALTPKIFGQRGRRRAESLGIEPDRLPPGQSPTLKWPVLSVGATPHVAPEQWLLSIDGAVEQPYVVRWDELIAAPATGWTGDIHCVTRWSKFGMRWRGVSVDALLERARPTAGATHLLAHSFGGYTTNLPLSDVLEHPALVAYEAEGAPLEPDHGGPARLLVPHLYLWKSAKWVNRLEVLETDVLGFWEENGYHHRGDPWQEERYSVDEYVARARRREVRRGG